MSGLMREWSVARLQDIDSPGTLEFRVGDRDWPFRGVLVRDAAGLRAFANICPHLGHPLNLDRHRFFAADGLHLVCASHGALFDPVSGHCVAGPCKGKYLHELELRVEQDTVWVTAPASRRDFQIRR